MSVVSYEVVGNIGVITINNPPVNALSHAVREGIVSALESSASDDSQALIIRCAGSTFIAGADITEFGKPAKSPSLPEVLHKLDTHSKLTIAVIHGTALGGGFETALSCNYRMASADSKVGLPEVKLGLLPGAGGTQRTPRLAGAEHAIELMTSGIPIPASQALEWSLVDRVEWALDKSDVRDPLYEAALEYANELVEQNAELRRASEIAFALDEEAHAYIEKTRETLTKKTRGERAPNRILDCVIAAAELPFDAGIRRERELFMECMADPQSAALRHMFFAERAASKIDGIQIKSSGEGIKSVGVIGAGTMGGGIAMCFAQAGFDVMLVDTYQEAVDAGINRIRKNYEISVQRGRLGESAVTQFMDRIKSSVSYQDLANADLVIEAVFENLAIKKSVFKELDSICKETAVLATNTSYQSIDEIAAVTSRPQQVCGMHFFSPANVMKLLEVVRAEKTSDEVIATVMAVGKRIGKTAVLSGMCYGFIGNRMLRPYVREAGLCLLEGASPEQIDSAIERWGMAMGPLAVGDLAGLDIGYKARQQLSEADRGDTRAFVVADRLVEAGRLGQKTGAGYYIYDEKTRQRSTDPRVMEVVEQARQEMGIERRGISDEEIVDRLTLALANEGAKILEEGIAQRASDIDVVYCYGYGFPRHRGGPIHAMEARGLGNALAKLKGFADELGEDNWKPAELIVRLAASGGTLSKI